MKVKDLKPNPKNPRKATDEKIERLAKSLGEFGPLDGVIFNRKTKQLVGGHQRTKKIPPNTPVVITRTFKKPTKAGTVAEGHIEFQGERIPFRMVEWDSVKEKAANLAANKGAGEWDEELLSEFLRDLDDFGFDLDLTLFDKEELEQLLVPTVSPNFEPGTEEEQGQLDQKKKVECPECGHEFTPRA